MRDVHNFTRPWEQKRYIEYPWSPGVWNLSQTLTGTAPKYRSQRSDITPTTPINGVYYRVTEYEAFFGHCTSRSGSGEQLKVATFDNHYRYEWTGYHDEGLFLWGTEGGASLRPAIPGYVMSQARTAIRSKLRNNILNLGTTFGEMPQTVRYLGTLLRKGLELLRGVRNAKWGANQIGTSSTWSQTAAEAFLGVKFGIMPVMSDAYAAANIISQGLQAPSGAVKVVVMDDSFQLPDASPYANTYPRRYSGTVKRGVEIGHTFSVENPRAYELWRYGLTDPLAVAWELVTLSFVVDWFTGLGAFFQGLQQPIGLRHHEGYETKFLETQMALEFSPVDAGSLPKYVGDWRHVDVHVRAMHRAVANTFTGPLPYLQFGIDQSQAAVIAALLIARS